MYRTNNCGDLDASFEGKEVTLSGWVHRRRDHGGLIFIDLRDRYGLTQVVSDPNFSEAVHKIADSLRPEFVIKISGKVRLRPDGMINKNMKTGEVEIIISSIVILNKSKTPPFEIDQDKEVGEEIRLNFRYLDLRKERMKNNIILRHKVVKLIRDIMDEKGFLEIETPILIKGTPEGSREYLVPSRLYPGNFYVLPQSPQQLKQMLMVAGFDRYFQMARCFRDEDQRGDRQPEFTQLDMEMSFVEMEDLMALNEEILIKLTQELVPHKTIKEDPFKRLTWQEAMDSYGSDKPDLRFDMPIVDVSDIVSGCEFKVFTDALSHGGKVRALRVEGGAKFTRKEIDEFTELARGYGAKGLAYIQYVEDGPKSPFLKFMKEEEMSRIAQKTDAKTGDIVFFAADSFKVVCESMAQVRLAAGEKLGLRGQDVFAYCWVYDFPLFSWDEESGRLNAEHHPFTSPKSEDLPKLSSDPKSVRAIAYDIVLNGTELGGGSIRIHDSELQAKIFDLMKISPQDAEKRFGHILKAFEYGAPPHGGIAWGLDRFMMLICDEPNIREVIAFPKDQKARDLMLDAPSEMPNEQITEAHIQIAKKNG